MRDKIIYYFILLSFGYSQLYFINTESFKVKPIFHFHYSHNGHYWYSEEKAFFIGGYGINCEYTKDNLFISTNFINNRLFGSTSKPETLMNESIAWGGNKNSSGSIPTFDFDYSKFIIEYAMNKIKFYFGNHPESWGPAKHSITISSHSPLYTKAGFRWSIVDNINFKYFHGFLRSRVEDEVLSEYYFDVPYNKYWNVRTGDIPRYLAAHRIDIKLLDKVHVGLNEMIVYGGRSPDANYLFPFMLYWSAEHYLGDKDNVLLSADITYDYFQESLIFISFLMDEWRPSLTFQDKNNNWFAYQFGIKNSAFLPTGHSLVLECTKTDPRIYRHRFHMNDYYTNNSPVGFWGGPNTTQFHFNYEIKLNNHIILLDANLINRGEITAQMLSDQYLQKYAGYNGLLEEILNIELRYTREIMSNFSIYVSAAYIDWNNYNLRPYQSYIESSSILDLEDVNKATLKVGFSYNSTRSF